MLRDHPKWRTAKGAVTGMLLHTMGPVAYEWLVILWLSFFARGARNRATDENRS